MSSLTRIVKGAVSSASEEADILRNSYANKKREETRESDEDIEMCELSSVDRESERLKLRRPCSRRTPCAHSRTHAHTLTHAHVRTHTHTRAFIFFRTHIPGLFATFETDNRRISLNNHAPQLATVDPTSFISNSLCFRSNGPPTRPAQVNPRTAYATSSINDLVMCMI